MAATGYCCVAGEICSAREECGSGDCAFAGCGGADPAVFSGGSDCGCGTWGAGCFAAWQTTKNDGLPHGRVGRRYEGVGWPCGGVGTGDCGAWGYECA